MPSLIFAIGFLYIPQIARIVRANVMSEYNQDYVRAVVVSGARAPWILWKHVVRNCVAPVLVFTIVLVADAIVFEASCPSSRPASPSPRPRGATSCPTPAAACLPVVGGRRCSPAS